MGHEILNRDGKESFRNKAKPFKAPRIISETNEYHPLDYMKLTATGKHTISNGSFGQKASTGTHLSIVKHTPGRSRPGRKNKNVSRMFSGNQHKQFMEKSQHQLLELRNDILSFKWLCEFSGKRGLFSKKLHHTLDTLNNHIKIIFTKQELEVIYSKDLVRKKTLLGRTANNSIEVAPIKSIDQRIARAMTIIQFSNKGRKEQEVINKRE